MAVQDVTALEDVLGRVEKTLAEVGDRFPLYADPDTGTWRTTGRGSWTAGCWVGLLWLRARLTGTARAIRDAVMWSARLEYWADADTATQGLILWYGAAAGSWLGLSDEPTERALRGARSLTSRFDAQAGLVPWGTALGDTPAIRAKIDGVPGTLPLLAWAGEHEIARAHTELHLRLCASAPGWLWDGGSWHQEENPPPGWSRGTAWLLLATADAATWLGEDLTRPAPAWPDPLPAAVGTGGPLDTSAAVALLKLYDAVLVEYHVTEDAVVLFVARRNSPRPEVVRVPLTHDALASLIAESFGDTGSPVRDGEPVRWQRALSPLIAPVVERCSEGEVVWFVPHDLLRGLPLHAIEVDGRPLLQRNPVCYTASASVMGVLAVDLSSTWWCSTQWCRPDGQ